MAATANAKMAATASGKMAATANAKMAANEDGSVAAGADGRDSDLLTITPLGAGQEVGRSCIIVRFKGKTIMLDCGTHPAYKGLPALPYFDVIDPEEVDLVLVSHFHLDHIASLPYFTEKTKFKGKVFMTHASKAIGLLLIKDYIRVSNLSVNDTLFDEHDLERCFSKIEAIDFHQTVELEGVKFFCHHAGHVLGGSMFNIEIAGVKICYTGDYSREEDRHLPAAELPPSSPDVLICESTYGKQLHEPLPDRESRFTRMVRDILLRGGRCLLPVFASGRAQELLLILDEFWEAHPELQKFPIYYASALANKCMGVYQTYINMMNARIRRQFPVHNPFKFKHIVNLKSREHFEDIGPCVMMASPGMLQSGISRELFESWCTDPRNGVIIPGYSVEGTLAKTILSNPRDIMTMDGRKLPLRMSVAYISFSAHVDYAQNTEFIKLVNPKTLVLVHGDSHEMMRLKTGLTREYEEVDRAIDVRTPKNCEDVELHFRGERMAKVIGTLAAAQALPGATSLDPDAVVGADGALPAASRRLVEGIVATKDFNTTILAPADLVNFTGLTTRRKSGHRPWPNGPGEAPPACSVITQRLAVHYPAESLSLLRVHLEMMFQSVTTVERPAPLRLDGTGGGKGTVPGLRVFDVIDVLVTGPAFLTLEWTSGAANDLIADSVLATILQIHAAPASIEALHQLQEHDEPKADGAPLLAALKREPADPVLAAPGNQDQDGGKRASDDGDDDKADAKAAVAAALSAPAADSKKPRPVSVRLSDAEIDRNAAAYAASLPAILVQHLLDGVRQHYDMASLDPTGQLITVAVDGLSALIDCRTRDVKCEDARIKKRLQSIVQRTAQAVLPIAASDSDAPSAHV